MPGKNDDEDGNAGEIPAPACPRHRGHSRGEKPPPPTVHLMRHSGPPAGTEWQSPYHSSVRQGSGVEEAADSGGGAEGEIGEGLQGIWGATRECNGVLIPGKGVDGRRQ